MSEKHSIVPTRLSLETCQTHQPAVNVQKQLIRWGFSTFRDFAPSSPDVHVGERNQYPKILWERRENKNEQKYAPRARGHGDDDCNKVTLRVKDLNGRYLQKARITVPNIEIQISSRSYGPLVWAPILKVAYDGVIVGV